MMQNDVLIIEMNIARYQAMLKSAKVDDKTRSLVKKLLAEAQGDLMLAADLKGG